MEDYNNLMQEVIANMAKQLNKKREDLIFDMLAILGHTFETEEQKIDFIKLRLTLRTNPTYSEVILDGEILVARWNNEISITQGWNDENHSWTVTAKQ